MAEGRLKIGDNFLKIGSLYLRIGPAPTPPTFSVTGLDSPWDGVITDPDNIYFFFTVDQVVTVDTGSVTLTEVHNYDTLTHGIIRVYTAAGSGTLADAATATGVRISGVTAVLDVEAADLSQTGDTPPTGQITITLSAGVGEAAVYIDCIAVSADAGSTQIGGFTPASASIGFYQAGPFAPEAVGFDYVYTALTQIRESLVGLQLTLT